MQLRFNRFLTYFLGLITIKAMFSQKKSLGNNFMTHLMSRNQSKQNQIQNEKYQQLYETIREPYNTQEQLLLKKDKY